MASSVSENDTQNDEVLVQRAREGDGEAFGKLVERHHANCVNVATFILRDRAEAEDEVQKACWNALRHLDQYRDRGGPGFSAWLSRIVKNQCLMLIRTRSRARLVHLDAVFNRERGCRLELPSVDSDAEKKLMEHQISEVLHRQIRLIPPLLRSVIVLRDVEELSMSAVAARLQITIPAAKSRLLRERQELRERVLAHCSNKGKGRACLHHVRTLHTSATV